VREADGWKCRQRTLRTSHDPATLRRNVDSSDSLVVTTKLVYELEVISRLAVELDVVVACDSNSLAITSEGVVGNRSMEEVVDFWAGHRAGELVMVEQMMFLMDASKGGALYYCLALIWCAMVEGWWW